MARTVWLTFDDGPNPIKTPVVLKALKDNNIQATFFMIGNVAGPNLETAKKVAAAGHLIGNHTYTHAVLEGKTKAQIKKEIQDAEEKLKGLSTYKKWFRPPEGKLDTNVREVATELGYQIVLWNVDTKDWQSKDHKIWIPKGISGIKDVGGKSVVLNHDIWESTANHVQEFIDEIKKLGDASFGAPKDMPLIDE
jgi:peptidoglycan/xylan/chitin deacetylase (PgdA/CDA1 family)